MVTREHTPDRPTDWPPHVSTCAHTLALLRYEYVLTWGGRSVGRSGVCSCVTIILVCYFLVIFYIYIYIFKKRGVCAPPHPPAYFLGGLRPPTPPPRATLFSSLFYNLGQFIGKHKCTLRLHVANYLAGSMSMLVLRGCCWLEYFTDWG